MIDSKAIQAAADRLWKAQANQTYCDPIRDLIGTDDLVAAYAVQDINTQRKIARGEKVVGAKIGLTSVAVQKQLGVDQPDFGKLTDAMMIMEGDEVPWNELMQPKIEMEIAFRLDKDLGADEPTMDTLTAAIGAALPAAEIVGSRIANWDIRITDTIADNASASHFVVGKPVVNWQELNLEEAAMALIRDGKEVSTGVGRACMDNPLNAALWLARTMHRLGQPLQRGEFILAGALGPMVVAEPGDQFDGHIDGFDPITVTFGRA